MKEMQLGKKEKTISHDALLEIRYILEIVSLLSSIFSNKKIVFFHVSIKILQVSIIIYWQKDQGSFPKSLQPFISKKDYESFSMTLWPLVL
jgi:hypothetical protein